MRSLCLDVGTSVVKAVLVDRDGVAQRVERREVGVSTGADGRAEQDPTEVWQAVRACLRALADGSPSVLAVTAQGDGCWLLDEQLEPVGPAVLWSDARAASAVTRWDTAGVLPRLRAENGGLAFAGSPGAVLEWLARCEPDRLAAAHTATSCGGFVVAQLCGRRSIEHSDAAHPFGSVTDPAWSDAAIELLDASGVRRLLPDVVDLRGAVSPLRSEVAAELGLPDGLPVVQTPYDVPASAIGSGCTGPGDAFAVLGTALICGTVRSPGASLSPASPPTIPLGVDDLLLEFHPSLTGVSVLAWGAAMLGLTGVRDVMELAAEAAPGSGGVRVLPFLSRAGERAPFHDPAAPGALLGLSFDTDRPEIARALVEGLSMVVREALGGGNGVVHVGGGGARSDLWCEVLASATGRTVRRLDVDEAGARGAMICARIALGELTDLAEAAERLAVPARDFEPDPAQAAVLDQVYDDCRRLRTALR